MMKNGSKGTTVGFWIATGLFCVQMTFTAYAQLRLPQVSEAFAHLGFPDYFRVRLSWVKLLGIVVLLTPAPARLKEWAYAGFAFDLGGAVLAHLAVGDDGRAWSWPAATSVLWALSYFFWRRRGGQSRRAAPTESLAWVGAARSPDDLRTVW